MKEIFVRTHGGLGNQLFQIFFALCKMHEYERDFITVIHDDRYPHKFQLCSKFKTTQSFLKTETISRSGYRKIIYHRFVKIIEKLRLGTPCINVHGHMIIDGYLQATHFYEKFQPDTIRLSLKKISKLFEIQNTKKLNKKLYHVRLGDFFGSEKEKYDHIMMVLNNIEDDTHIITNEEYYFSDNSLIAKALRQKNIVLISTSKLKDFELLELMMSYKTINSNNSTLAFWATVLSKAELKISNKKLTELKGFILGHAD